MQNSHIAVPLFIIFVILSMRSYLRRRHMPPGPIGLPIVGNLFQMPVTLPWIKFFEISKRYGPVISFNAAGQSVIVLNDHKSAYELLDRRSTNYSHRPRFIMAGEWLCDGIMLSFISYGDLFRRMRRVTHDTFGPHAAEQFQPLQEREAVNMVLDILEAPDDWDAIVKMSTSSNILTATYGWPRLSESYMPLVKRIHAHTATLSNACIPGKSIVDIFSFLNYLPLWMAKWKRNAFEWHKRESKMFEGFNDEVAQRMTNGEEPDCFVSSMIKSGDRNGLSKKEAAWLAGIMFSAGAETTTASVANFILAMVHYPNVMRKAQAEIDGVVGPDRVPTFADRPYLPYLQAVVKELLRWRPAGPLGIPRRVAQDDWYGGYFIPKGATVISNIWAINRDPDIYQDPEEFLPERFLNGAGTEAISPPDMHSLGHSSFGFGRRTCVGVTFGSQSLFIDFALLLWTFNIDKAQDAHENEILPSLTEVIDAGVVVGPVPFQCKLTPRFPEAAMILKRTKAEF